MVDPAVAMSLLVRAKTANLIAQIKLKKGLLLAVPAANLSPVPNEDVAQFLSDLEAAVAQSTLSNMQVSIKYGIVDPPKGTD